MYKSNAFARLMRDTKGVAAIEYVVLSSTIALVIIGALAVTGTRLSSTFEKVDGNGTESTATAEPAEPVASPIRPSRPIGRPIAMPVAISEAEVN